MAKQQQLVWQALVCLISLQQAQAQSQQAQATQQVVPAATGATPACAETTEETELVRDEIAKNSAALAVMESKVKGLKTALAAGKSTLNDYEQAISKLNFKKFKASVDDETYVGKQGA